MFGRPGTYGNPGDFLEDNLFSNIPTFRGLPGESERERIERERARLDPFNRCLVYWRTPGHLCGVCGWFVSYYEDWEIDHKIPLFLGGTSDHDNLQLTHRFCNRSKGAAVPYYLDRLYRSAFNYW